MRLVIRLLAGLAAVMLSALLLITLVPVAFGWHSQVVVSGSMRPAIRPGDVIIVQPVPAYRLTAGQIVAVDNPAKPGTRLLHRLVRRNADGTLVTRGDANDVDDSTPVPPESVVGLARLRVPYIGLGLLWWQQGRYGPLALAVLLVLTIAYVASSDPKARPTVAAGRHRAHGRATSGAAGRHRAVAV